MPTYLQLQAEPVWGAQYVPASLTDLLIAPLRSFYSLGPAAVNTPGDNDHLYGRHRSANWDRTSIYCPPDMRYYGTTDARDKRGDQNIYRAVDVGIKGQVLQDACRRLDTLVRSDGAPGVAEWFGTFDGVNVVGWYEGHPSSSDDSHLWHLHVGFWNEAATDAATLTAVYNAITGTEDDMTQDQEDMLRLAQLYALNASAIGFGMARGLDAVECYDTTGGAGTPFVESLRPYYQRVAVEVAKLSGGTGGGLTEAQTRAAVRAELDDTRLVGP